MGAKITYIHLSLCSLLITTFFFQVCMKVRTCPEEWLRYHNKCYGVFTKRVTWADAEAICQKSGSNGHLVSFHSAPEADTVATHIINNFPEIQRVWIGFNDAEGVGKWNWSDDSVVNNYRPWTEGEPVRRVEGWFCASTPFFLGFIRWDIWDCMAKLPFVCKRDL